MTSDVPSPDAAGENDLRAEIAHLQQAVRIKHLGEFFGGPWVLVRRSDDVSNGFFVFACLIPIANKTSFLQTVGWDFQREGLQPRIECVSHSSGEQDVYYLRHGNERGAEPLFHCRFHSNQWPASIEVAEEFILFFNLYHDRSRNILLHCDVDGVEDEVALIQDNTLQIKLAYLARYLRAKQMHLAVQFVGHASSVRSLTDFGLEPGTRDEEGENHHYQLSLNHWDLRDEYRSISRLIGKLIMPCPGPIRWEDPYANKHEGYADFIVDIDAEGSAIRSSCKCERDGNRSDDFLTPVYFKREVLQKYFSEPARYAVEDGRLSCGGLWSLRMDNDHPRRVGVWLGDLGYLNMQEQAHWRGFNVAPDDRFSETFITRNIRAFFADPTMPDLVFKNLLPRVNKAWQDRFGWPLWREPHPQDQYIFNKLHVSLGDEQSEFDEQNLLLAKTLVDFLNEEELAKRGGTLPSDAKGIAKLTGFLRENGFSGGDAHLEFLRGLQRLRSKGVHRKTAEYEDALGKLGLNSMHPVDASRRAFQMAVDLLQWLGVQVGVNNAA